MEAKDIKITYPLFMYLYYDGDDYYIDEYLEDFRDIIPSSIAGDFEAEVKYVQDWIDSLNIEVVSCESDYVDLDKCYENSYLVVKHNGILRGIYFTESPYNGVELDEYTTLDQYPLFEPVQVIKYKRKLLS